MPLLKGKDLEGVELWKFVNKDKKHFDHDWKEGVNTDSIPFWPHGYCRTGGLYFTELKWLFAHVNTNNLNDHYIGRIYVADDEDVWQDEYDCDVRWGRKWKAHTVTLGPLQRIGDLSNELYYNMVGSHYLRDKLEPYDESRHLELWTRIIHTNPWSIQYVRRFDKALYLEAIKLEATTYHSIAKPNLDICWPAVQVNVDVMKEIKNPTMLCKLLEKDGMLLEHMDHVSQNRKMVETAIANNPEAARYVSRRFLKHYPALMAKYYPP